MPKNKNKFFEMFFCFSTLIAEVGLITEKNGGKRFARIGNY